MRKASDKLIRLLDADQFIMADLYTITTIQGIEYHYTNYDVDLVVDGKVFQSNGPIISREGISLSLGIEVDNLSITIETTESTMFGEVPVAQAFHNGILDGSRFKLERIFMDINTLQILVLERWFYLKGVLLNLSLIDMRLKRVWFRK